VQSPTDGYIGSMNAEKISEAAMVLGAGRASKEDSIDYSAGIVLKAKTGDYVKAGRTIAVLYTNQPEKISDSASRILEGIRFTAEKPASVPLIYQVIK
ncbi:MAG: thymidine phosphorylase, partial [Lachnospiraceae bacterium]|nr:thymidine phosphorylase [Lachnospiraceae bacterium]